VFWGLVFSFCIKSSQIPGARLLELLNFLGDFWYVLVHSSYITCLVTDIWLVEILESSSNFLNNCRLLFYTTFVYMLNIFRLKHCLEFYRYLASCLHISRQGCDMKSGFRTTDGSAFPNQHLYPKPSPFRLFVILVPEVVHCSCDRPEIDASTFSLHFSIRPWRILSTGFWKPLGL